MAMSLTDIQTLARFHSKDQNLTLTSGTGLIIANEVFTALCLPDGEIAGVKIGRRWRELTIENTSITSVLSQEDYAFPVLPTIIDEPYLEYIDASSSNYPWPLTAIPDQTEWSYLQPYVTGIPRFYRIYSVAGQLKLSLRPNPDTTGDTVKITGIRQPDEFVNGGSTTPFRLKQIDRALALLIAAEYKHQRDEADYAATLVAKAQTYLPKNDYAPRQESGRIRPWGNDTRYRYRYQGVYL